MDYRYFKLIKSQSGISLIEAILALSMLSILAFSMLSITNSIQRQMKATTQRQDVFEFRNLLNQQLSKGSICSWQLAGQPVDISGVLTQSSPSSTIIDLPRLYQGPDNTSAILAEVGSRLPGSDLVVSKILFKDIYKTGNPNEYMGTFEIQFDPSTVAGIMKPIQHQKLFMANPISSTSADILSCGNSMSNTPPIRGVFCNTYSSCGGTDGKCHIAGSENALACFLSAVDDDTARVDFAGLRGLSSTDWPEVDVWRDSTNQPKCEILPNPMGGWMYRASMSCELVACAYTCVFL